MSFKESHNKYDSDASSTYTKDGRDIKIQYKTGDVSGFVSKDKVCIADLCIDDQGFAEVTDESGDGFMDAPYDGMLGLGFKGISVDNLPTVIDNIVDQEKVDVMSVSFWLNKNPDDDNAGVMAIGGEGWEHERFYHKPLLYLGVFEETAWHIPLYGIVVGANTSMICTRECTAVVDTGSSLIGGPKDQVDVIHNVIGADKDGIIDCATIPDLPLIMFRFEDEGPDYPLTSEDYVLKVTHDGQTVCTSGFTGIENPEREEMWVLGSVFMRKFYTVLGVFGKAVGFALAKQN